MGVPAVKKTSPKTYIATTWTYQPHCRSTTNTQNNNSCLYTDGDGNTTFASSCLWLRWCVYGRAWRNASKYDDSPPLSVAPTSSGFLPVPTPQLESLSRRRLCNTAGRSKCPRLSMPPQTVAPREHQVDSLEWEGGRISRPPYRHHWRWEDRDGRSFGEKKTVTGIFLLPHAMHHLPSKESRTARVPAWGYCPAKTLRL